MNERFVFRISASIYALHLSELIAFSSAGFNKVDFNYYICSLITKVF